MQTRERRPFVFKKLGDKLPLKAPRFEWPPIHSEECWPDSRDPVHLGDDCYGATASQPPPMPSNQVKAFENCWDQPSIHATNLYKCVSGSSPCFTCCMYSSPSSRFTVAESRRALKTTAAAFRLPSDSHAGIMAHEQQVAGARADTTDRVARGGWGRRSSRCAHGPRVPGDPARSPPDMEIARARARFSQAPPHPRTTPTRARQSLLVLPCSPLGVGGPTSGAVPQMRQLQQLGSWVNKLIRGLQSRGPDDDQELWSAFLGARHCCNLQAAGLKSLVIGERGGVRGLTGQTLPRSVLRSNRSKTAVC